MCVDCLHEFTITSSGHPSAVAFTPDGHCAISASSDTTKVWDLKTGEIITEFIGDALISSCAVSSDGMTIVVGDNSARVHFLRLEEKEPHLGDQV